MDFYLLGKGKTGSHVIELANERALNLIKALGSKDEIEVDLINQSQGLIIFTPEQGILENFQTLLKINVPVIIGATGVKWTTQQLESIKSNNLKWIHGHNFSLGMNIIRHQLESLSKTSFLMKDKTINIHEIHHTKKLDAPSGTAIKWKDWVNLKDISITHERTGDVIGIHEIEVSNSQERITIKHESLDRKLFANGALWALENSNLLSEFEPGIINFEDFVDRALMS